MRKVAILFSVFLYSLNALSQGCDPEGNKEVNPKIAEMLCQYASVSYEQRSSILTTLDVLSPFEAVLMGAADKYEEAYRLSDDVAEKRKKGEEVKVEIPIDWYKDAGEWWDEYGYKIYCVSYKMDRVSFCGYLNFHLLKTGQEEFLNELYHKNGKYQANINQIVLLNPCDENSPQATFLDIIEHAIQNPVGQMNDRPSIIRKFETYLEIFSSPGFGGKRFSEMTPEEIEQNSQ